VQGNLFKIRVVIYLVVPELLTSNGNRAEGAETSGTLSVSCDEAINDTARQDRVINDHLNTATSRRVVERLRMQRQRGLSLALEKKPPPYASGSPLSIVSLQGHSSG